MDTNFNETFLDENSTVINYYLGIPNMEIGSTTDIENIIKKYKKLNLDYLSINIFNFYLHSFISKNNNNDLLELINNFILSISKKYKITFIFSYSISANPVAYFDCWNSKFIYKGDVQTMKDFTQYLINDNSSFLTVKKPHRGILSLSQSETMRLKLCSVEVCTFNDDCSITDYENIYYSLLDRGWMLGAISCINTAESNEWFTGIISRHCYPDMLIESIKNKATYSTKISDLKLYFSVNFVSIGKSLKIDSIPSTLSFYIFADTKYKTICSIEVLSNGKKSIKKSSMICLSRVHYNFKYTMDESNTWFVVRLIGKNGTIAISSPVFVSYKKSID